MKFRNVITLESRRCKSPLLPAMEEEDTLENKGSTINPLEVRRFMKEIDKAQSSWTRWHLTICTQRMCDVLETPQQEQCLSRMAANFVLITKTGDSEAALNYRPVLLLQA